jgi:uncharacterized protein (DUF302 family)
MVSFRTILVLFFFSTSLWASETAPAAATATESRVYKKTVKADFTETYKKVFTSLENNGYFVLIEPNIGKNLSNYEQRWGKNYNKNELEAIRSLVFCNGWYANEISNLDPDMLALCPLHITLTHKKGITTILFVRPSQVAAHSPAKDIAEELEQDVIRAIEQGLLKESG